MSKKILSIFVLVLTLSFSTQAFASFTFTTDAITGTTASSIDLGVGNALSLQTTGNGAINLGTGMVTLGGNITIPMTTSSDTGVIYKGVTPFIHNFTLTGTSGFNTFVGIEAGNFTMTGSTGLQGSFNTGVGYNSLKSNTTGQYNTGVGYTALQSNTTGFGNTGIGLQALKTNVSGNSNTGIGMYALRVNTIGQNNTATGYQALASNTEGVDNTANGIFTLVLNTTGSSNTASGKDSLFNIVTGSGNVALGYSAGKYETGSNSFYVNNVSQGNTANDKAYSLLYGTFSGTAGSLAGQKLTVNALLNVNIAKLSVYANNAAALGGGLVPGDLYRTGGDPDPIMVVH